MCEILNFFLYCFNFFEEKCCVIFLGLLTAIVMFIVFPKLICNEKWNFFRACTIYILIFWGYLIVGLFFLRLIYCISTVVSNDRVHLVIEFFAGYATFGTVLLALFQIPLHRIIYQPKVRLEKRVYINTAKVRDEEDSNDAKEYDGYALRLKIINVGRGNAEKSTSENRIKNRWAILFSAYKSNLDEL